ncbi:MAG: hypothetical protein Gyms2KO_03560 [Gymnodinialimonas sp.]
MGCQRAFNLRITDLYCSIQRVLVKEVGFFSGNLFSSGGAVSPKTEANIDGHTDKRDWRDNNCRENKARYNGRRDEYRAFETLTKRASGH